MNIKNQLLLGFILLLLGAIGGTLLAHAWATAHPATVTQLVRVNVPVPAQPLPPVVKVQKEFIPCPVGVQVYQAAAKPALAKAHALPDAVAEDPAQHVLAASEVAPDDHPHAVTSVFDQTTGAVQTFDTRLPYAPLAADLHRDIAVAYGLRTGSGGAERVLRIEARQDMVAVYGVRLGGFLGLDAPMGGGPVAGFVGIGAAKAF